MILSAILLSAALYIAPGLSLLSLVDLGPVPLGRRLFAGLCVSMVIVPYAYLVASIFGQVVPLPIHLVVGAVLVALAGAVLQRRNLRPQLSMAPGMARPTRLESVAVWAFLMAFAALANVPRLDMLLAGGATRMIPLWDEPWHLSELVSVARSGIPPDHYFFPTVRLAYNYGAWIYPAVLGNASPSISLARAMAIHSWMVSFVFAGTVYSLLLRLVRSAMARLVGVAFFTILGGLDLFASLPSITQIDWWQERVGWLVSHQQISQWITLYEWVPQHLYAGALFLLGMWLWSSLPDRATVRNVALATLLGLTFSSSPFVFAAAVLSVSIVLFHERRSVAGSVQRAPRHALALGVLLLACVALPALPLADIYLRHGSALFLNDWRVPLLETLRGNLAFQGLDRALTLFGLPIVGLVVAFIELGVPLLLYVAWWIALASRRDPSAWTSLESLVALQPLLFFFATLLIRDSAGNATLSMRGLIPSQALVCLAATVYLDHAIPWLRVNKIGRWSAVYLMVAFCAAQGASTAAEWRDNSADLLQWILSGRPGERAYPYVEWVNRNTPPDALLVEQGCPDVDRYEYRWLERRRLLLPECAATMSLHEVDRSYTLPREWIEYSEVATRAEGSALKLLDLLDVPGKDAMPVFEVVWPDEPLPSTGALVYEDATVKVFRIQ